MDYEHVAEQHELGGCAEKIAALESAVEHMKSVVTAAQEWSNLQSVGAVTAEDAAIRLVERK